MKKYINLAGVLLVIAMSAVSLWAQDGSVKGVATDQAGKPIVGATVVILDVQTGRKYQLKTNAKGEYFSIGIAIGTYKFSLMQNGTSIDEHNNVPIEGGAERIVPFDLAKDLGAATAVT